MGKEIPGKLTAISTISMNGFLAESAPVIIQGRRPERKIMILLDGEQRDNLWRWLKLNFSDHQYQGKFPGALPQGWEYSVELGTPYPQSWNNAGNQWIDSQELFLFIEQREKQGLYEDTKGMDLLRGLVEKASKL